MVSVHQSSPQRNGTSTEAPGDSTSEFQFFLPSRNGYLFLEQSPPVIIGNATIRKLLQKGVKIDSPFLIPGNPNPEEEGINVHMASRLDRSSISSSTVRLLLAHYTRCIEPVFPTAITLADDTEASLKHMKEIDRCRVLLACAIAAIHKSYYGPAWKIVATTCREWAEELAAELMTRRDDQTVIILLLLIIYELADPERGLIWELLSFADRACLELGWHRTDDQDIQQLTGPAMPPNPERGRLSTEAKKRILSVLIHIERTMNILVHRPSVLSCSTSWNLADSDLAYNHCIKLMQLLFESGVAPEDPAQCPLTGPLSPAIDILQSMPPSEVLTHVGWTLLQPTLANHPLCGSCSSFSTMARSTSFDSLHARVLSEAACLIDTAHALLVCQHAFIPPIFASCRAFVGGCLLITANSCRWPSAETYSAHLMKCSEVLAFTVPMWKGGRDYYDVWRQIARGV